MRRSIPKKLKTRYAGEKVYPGPRMNFDLLNALSFLEKPDGVVAFPTDTVYGIGCMINKQQAADRIYRVKGRDEQKPLILLGCEPGCFKPYVDVLPDRARELMEKHWPGALTIILPRSEEVSDTITRGHDSIGLRMPACKTLNELLAMVPHGLLATTSANRSGDPPALTADEVFNAFGDDIDYVVRDDAAIRQKVASTVVKVDADGNVTVLREGSVQIN